MSIFLIIFCVMVLWALWDIKGSLSSLNFPSAFNFPDNKIELEQIQETLERINTNIEKASEKVEDIEGTIKDIESEVDVIKDEIVSKR